MLCCVVINVVTMLVVTCLIVSIIMVHSSKDNMDFQLDFVHSFLVKNNKLQKTKRMDSAEERWIKKTGYMVFLPSP